MLHPGIRLEYIELTQYLGLQGHMYQVLLLFGNDDEYRITKLDRK